MKKYILITAIILALISPTVINAGFFDWFGSFFNKDNTSFGGGTGTINSLPQWRATSSPQDAVTTRVSGKNIYAPFASTTFKGLTLIDLQGSGTKCLELDNDGKLQLSGGACGGGDLFAWTPLTTYNENTSATTTPLWLQDTLYASSTAFFSDEVSIFATTTIDGNTDTNNLTGDVYDLRLGNGSGGLLRTGNALYGTFQGIVGNIDFTGVPFIKTLATPSSEVHFVFGDPDDEVRFALAEAGIDKGTYSPRSMIIAGPWVDNENFIKCSFWGFWGIDCNTGGTGADLGVQDDLQVLGDFYLGGNLTASSTITFESLGVGAVSSSATGVLSSGTLSIANGGTNATSLDNILGTTNQITITNGANTIIAGDTTIALASPLTLPTGTTTATNMHLTGNLQVDGILFAPVSITSSGILDMGEFNIINVGNIALDSITSDTGTSIAVTTGASAGNDFTINTSAFVVEGDTGNVGIGTASPDTPLHIVGSTPIKLERSGVESYTIGISIDGVSDVLQFNAVDTTKEILRLGSDQRVIMFGKVGIGTTTPAYLLDVDGDFRVGEAGANNNSFFVDASTGRVGIGTASPKQKVHIAGAAAAAFVGLAINNTNSSNAVDTMALDFGKISAGTYYNLGRIIGGNEINGNYNDSFLQFLTSTTANTPLVRMHINSDGNVGIGTTSPTRVLQIENSGANLFSVQRTGYDAYGLYQSVGTGVHFYNFTKSRTDIYINGGSGNVGIGTASPGRKLDVAGDVNIIVSSTNTALDISNTDTTNGYGVFIKGGGTTSGRYALAIQSAAGANLMRVLANGNVGIGTASPGALLHISKANGSGDVALVIQNNNITAGETTSVIFRTTTSNLDFGRMRVERIDVSNAKLSLASYQSGTLTDTLVIDSSGNVGIGDTTPSYDLDVNANINYQGNLTNVSDLRFKKDIVTITSALDKINNIRGVTYKWRVDEFPDTNWSTSTTLGVIAQEVELVIPELVFTADDGYKSVDYSKFTPVLIEAIKEQQKQINTLIKRIEQLESVNQCRI